MTEERKSNDRFNERPVTPKRSGKGSYNKNRGERPRDGESRSNTGYERKTSQRPKKQGSGRKRGFEDGSQVGGPRDAHKTQRRRGAHEKAVDFERGKKTQAERERFSERTPRAHGDGALNKPSDAAREREKKTPLPDNKESLKPAFKAEKKEALKPPFKAEKKEFLKKSPMPEKKELLKDSVTPEEKHETKRQEKSEASSEKRRQPIPRRKSWADMNADERREENDRLDEEITQSIVQLGRTKL